MPDHPVAKFIEEKWRHIEIDLSAKRTKLAKSLLQYYSRSSYTTFGHCNPLWYMASEWGMQSIYSIDARTITLDDQVEDDDYSVSQKMACLQR